MQPDDYVGASSRSSGRTPPPESSTAILRPSAKQRLQRSHDEIALATEIWARTRRRSSRRAPTSRSPTAARSPRSRASRSPAPPTCASRREPRPASPSSSSPPRVDPPPAPRAVAHRRRTSFRFRCPRRARRQSRRATPAARRRATCRRSPSRAARALRPARDGRVPRRGARRRADPQEHARHPGRAAATRARLAGRCDDDDRRRRRAARRTAVATPHDPVTARSPRPCSMPRRTRSRSRRPSTRRTRTRRTRITTRRAAEARARRDGRARRCRRRAAAAARGQARRRGRGQGDQAREPPVVPDPPKRPRARRWCRRARSPKLSGELPTIRGDVDGDALVKMCIDATGAVSSVNVVHATSQMPGDLTRALKGWRYKPSINKEGTASPACFASAAARRSEVRTATKNCLVIASR